ncbi:MAG: EVE domain-containing protein [Dehalococcoidia bacterium]|nr:EVE domain-containing protein [Dehalococcoidia bacterium]
MPTYWIVVGSEENMRIAEARGFDVFGFKSTRRREVAGMQPGDKLIFYLTKIMKFGGLAEVTSDYFEDHTKVFKSEKKPVLSAAEGPQEDYPFRVNVTPEIVLTPEQYLDVKEIAPRMEYTKKWPVEHWRLAFQGNLHQIPQADYELIVLQMKAAAGVRA